MRRAAHNSRRTAGSPTFPLPGPCREHRPHGARGVTPRHAHRGHPGPGDTRPLRPRPAGRDAARPGMTRGPAHRRAAGRDAACLGATCEPVRRRPVSRDAARSAPQHSGRRGQAPHQSRPRTAPTVANSRPAEPRTPEPAHHAQAGYALPQRAGPAGQGARGRGPVPVAGPSSPRTSEPAHPAYAGYALPQRAGPRRAGRPVCGPCPARRHVAPRAGALAHAEERGSGPRTGGRPVVSDAARDRHLSRPRRKRRAPARCGTVADVAAPRSASGTPTSRGTEHTRDAQSLPLPKPPSPEPCRPHRRAALNPASSRPVSGRTRAGRPRIVAQEPGPVQRIPAGCGPFSRRGGRRGGGPCRTGGPLPTVVATPGSHRRRVSCRPDARVSRRPDETGR